MASRLLPPFLPLAWGINRPAQPRNHNPSRANRSGGTADEIGLRERHKWVVLFIARSVHILVRS